MPYPPSPHQAVPSLGRRSRTVLHLALAAVLLGAALAGWAGFRTGDRAPMETWGTGAPPGASDEGSAVLSRSVTPSRIPPETVTPQAELSLKPAEMLMPSPTPLPITTAAVTSVPTPDPATQLAAATTVHAAPSPSPPPLPPPRTPQATRPASPSPAPRVITRPPPPRTPTAVTAQAVGQASLRVGPSTADLITGYAPVGTSATVIGCASGCSWLLLSLPGGASGWSARHFWAVSGNLSRTGSP